MQFVALDDYFYKNSIYFCRILSFSFYKIRSVRRFNVLFVLKDDNNYGEFFMEKYISNFVDILKDYMFQKDLSRAEFAKNINSYERCISRWLDGTNTPSLEYILRVCVYGFLGNDSPRAGALFRQRKAYAYPRVPLAGIPSALVRE